jgi:DNA-binding SARP family transcriptional activator
MERQVNRQGGPARLDAAVASDDRRSNGRAVHQLRVGLLGGFRVERVDIGRPVSGWQRRSAKRLTKLLATHPRHALHREEILDILWPDVELESALNSLGKALYAARRAFEPNLLPRESSAYLQLTDAMLALNTEHVSIDADQFQRLAEAALRRDDVAAYEAALAAYGGELLPEDRYEDWCAQRRDFLAALQLRVLLGLADALEKRGTYIASADCLSEVLRQDPTREEVHRRLMVRYAELGARDQAVRQFHICQDVLRRELDLAPDKATLALFADVLANRIPRRMPAPEGGHPVVEPPRPGAIEQLTPAPFVGRGAVLGYLRAQLAQAEEGRGQLIYLSGEAGVGKTRLAAELAIEARERGAAVLSGGSGAHGYHFAYGPLAVALEGYVAGRPGVEREQLAERYPALIPFVPSLGKRHLLPAPADGNGDSQLHLLTALVQLLTDLAGARPVLLVLGDLHDIHETSLDLLQYLAHLAVQRRWLIVGTFREEGLGAPSELRAIIEATLQERLCLQVELQRLAREECDELVRALLSGARVADALLEQLYSRSLGNPLFVGELVREMRERGEVVRRAGLWQRSSAVSTRVPARVRALVAMRVAPMEESVRRVLALAAAAAADRAEISFTDLRRGASELQPPLSDAALSDALDGALECHMLEERDGIYTFRHPLVRAALYEDLSKHRRDQLRAALGGSTSKVR